MTAARRERKSSLAWAFAAGILAAGLIAGLTTGAVQAGLSDRIVTNRNTGLAIDGFDPVAYFVDGEPRLGRAELELRHADANWRFANEGNRAAFVAHPDVYMPRFGGYDPTAVARGIGTAGHPRVWRIAAQRLYLFYDDKARLGFMNDPDVVIDAAERHWPQVMSTLSR
jgi:hypothetical protein